MNGHIPRTKVWHSHKWWEEGYCIWCDISSFALLVWFCEFSLYIPMVIMVCIQNFVRRLPVHMLRVQGWVGISATCWVSWWLGLIVGTICRRGRDIPQCIGRKWSGSWMLSLPVLQNLSDVCVVVLVGTVCLIHQNILLGPMIINFPRCLSLVFIPALSIFHGFLLYHSVCRVLFCFLVVGW